MDLEDTVAWWGSLALLGALLVTAGLLVGADMGETVAIAGVALFFATAVLAGAERTEWATALGVAGVVWTAVGISLVLGSDPSRFGSLVGLSVSGAAMVLIGILGAARAHRRTADAAGHGPNP
ncbi:MAG: hypothetical protein WB947_02260 [Thermoplasmata archaeon]